MKTTVTRTSINRSSFPPPSYRVLFQENFHITTSVRFAPFPISRPARTLKCSKNGSPENGGSLKNLLSGMVDDRLELLLNKEENRVLLDGLDRAAQRVERAKRELAEIEKQEIEAEIMKDYVSKLESRAFEIAECQKEILEARLMVEEAERSLTEHDRVPLTDTEGANRDEERMESVKAALIAAVSGVLADLPISLTRVTSSSQLILPLAITFACCALFGVTFRYAIRRDLDNFQLKSGTSASFGLVKGLGSLGVGQPLELGSSTILSQAFDCAIYTSESLLIFLFAGVALDFCIKLRILSAFPIDRSASRT